MSSRQAPRVRSAGDGFERLLVLPGRRRMVAGVATAVAGPALATVVASFPGHRGTAVPALLYLIAVVAAAAIGHLWPGLLAAVLSFFALDYFFTAPSYTFAVSKSEDLISLAVFLAVAAVVSAAISATLELRAMAEFREQQVRALYNVTASLLSGTDLADVLQDLTGSLRRLYGLRGCRILVADDDGLEREWARSGEVDGSDLLALPLVTDERTVGHIEISGGSERIGGSEREVLATFGGQLALALERTRLGMMAEQARVEAEASRIRAALFSAVTHDLKTPLASITASASSLLEEGVPFSPAQREELLRTVLEEAERLNRLVGNLMDLSRLRAGALTPSVVAVPIEDLISAVTERLRPALAGRPLRILVREDVPPVAVDVVQMDQVLTNLIENAIRYSRPLTEIAISAARWQDMVEVRVADRGPGIPRGEREAVFREFYGRDVEEQRRGTGLGLAIARAIVAAHGGTMWIEDTPGGGTTVGFRLPLAGPPENTRGVRPVVAAGEEPDR